MNLASRATGPRRVSVHMGMNNATLNTLVAAGLMTELSHMTSDEAERALALETELMLDAKAGVDLRARLIGEAVSK